MLSRDKFSKAKYPFSDELCSFMDSNPEFLASLKLNNPARFILILIIGITYLPDNEPLSKDEVIGLFYLDKVNCKNNQQSLFKQDFIVNIGGQNQEFISYSASLDKGSYVKPIEEFFRRYGKNGKFYHKRGVKPWHHHYDTLDDLPDYEGLEESASEIISLLQQGKI